jgi:hypothetical protein
MRKPPIKEIDLKMENTESLCEVTTSASCRADIINGLLAQLEKEQDSDIRAEIIRKLGEYPDPQVIKTNPMILCITKSSLVCIR